MTLVVRTARILNAPTDALRVTRRGSWLGLPDQLPRCYLELRDAEIKPTTVARWRSSLRAHLRSVTNTRQWRELFLRPAVTLVCCCQSAPCARFIVAEYLHEQGALLDTENLK